jgi:MFS family permease
LGLGVRSRYAGILHPRVRRTLDAIGRIGSTPAILRPGESIPGSAPGLAAVPPLPLRGTGRGRTGRPALRASFRASYAEGAAAELVATCTGGTVLTAWALQLGATPFVIGLLGALPLAAQVLHLPSALLTQLLGPKPVAITAIGASRLVWLPLVALPFLSLPVAAQLSLFIAVAAAAAVLGVLGNNAWVAWMGDLVPGRLRGRFFSRRTIYITVAGTLASLSAGVALDAVTPLGFKRAMLSGLAALACLGGIFSVWLLLRQAAPRRVHDRKRPELRALARAALDPRIRPWLRYLLCWNVAVAISASFFSYHMLGYLGLGFAVVALHGVAVAVVRVATAPLWGHAVDRLGARPVLVLCSFGIAAVPALWLFIAPDFLWPLAVEAAAAGALWAGHGIASMDLTLNSAPADRRPYYVAVFGTTSGLGFGAASVLAGFAAASLPGHWDAFGTSWTAIHLLFLASAVARALAAFTALHIEERDAHPLGGVVRTIAGQALASLRLRRLPG